jgi:DNA-binding GntR family transcriptional regulator
LEANGLYDLLRRNGFVMRDATQRIGAEAAAIIEARQLRVRKGSPLLTMERLSFDKHARPIELGVHSYDATRYSVSVTLQHD